MSVQKKRPFVGRHRRTDAEKAKDQDDVYQYMYTLKTVKLHEIVEKINAERDYEYTRHHARPDREAAREMFRDITAYDPRTTLAKAQHIEEIADKIYNFAGIGSINPHKARTVKTETTVESDGEEGEDGSGRGGRGSGTLTVTEKISSLASQLKQKADLYGIADKLRRGIHMSHREDILTAATLRRDERAHETALIARAQEERKVAAIEAAAGAGNVQIVVAGSAGVTQGVKSNEKGVDAVIAGAREVLDARIKGGDEEARGRRSRLMADAEKLRMETATVGVLDEDDEGKTRTAEEVDAALAQKLDALARLRESIGLKWGLGGDGWRE